MYGRRASIALAACLLATLVGCNRGSGGLKSPLAALEDKMVFFPTKYPQGDWQPAGLQFEDAWFAAEDGTRLHAWYCPHENPRAVVLFAHGNARNLTDWADTLRRLHSLGVTAMTFDYRGYGRSEGSPDERGVLQDARAARAWLAQRTGIAESQIVMMGRSLGGGVAVDLAATDGARGLILESTFTSLPDVAGAHAAWLPAKTLMHNRLDSLAKIGKYHGPLLHSHGDADRLIPFEQGQRLFAAANEPKRFVTIPGGGHNDPQTEDYYRVLDGFFAALPAAGFQPR
jgi:uncharacterized protein